MQPDKQRSDWISTLSFYLILFLNNFSSPPSRSIEYCRWEGASVGHLVQPPTQSKANIKVNDVAQGLAQPRSEHFQERRFHHLSGYPSLCLTAVFVEGSFLNI